MRATALAWICLAACSATAVPPPSPGARPAGRGARGGAEVDRAPVDPIHALTPDDDALLSWVIPGPVRLELGRPVIGGAAVGRPVQVAAFDQQGSLLRVAVRLDHARFAAWVDRARLMAVLTRDQRISVPGAAVGSDIEVVLRAGAAVRRLAHRDGATQIRYLGALQVEGWVPDAVLAERGPARAGSGRIPTGRRTLMVVPGAVIRAQPRWAASPLAVIASGYFLDTIRELDDGWTEVSYEDGEVAVHGFVSRRDPPARVHHWGENDTAPPVAPNATVASGTCLYSRANGDAIGYVVGTRPASLEEAEPGWWVITIDTPWGPVGFGAQGAGAGQLAICAPPGTVPPPPAPAPPPTP